MASFSSFPSFLSLSPLQLDPPPPRAALAPPLTTPRVSTGSRPGITLIRLFHPRSLLPQLPSAAARGCDLKCKLKYSSRRRRRRRRRLRANRFDINGVFLSHQGLAREFARSGRALPPSSHLLLCPLRNGEKGKAKQRTLSIKEK